MMKLLSTLVFCLVLLATGNVAYAEVVVGWMGQSLCEGMFSDNGVYVAPNPYTYQWNPSTNSWGTVNGAGAREYANMVNAQTGQPVYMISGCVGGTTIAQWTDTTPGSVLMNFMGQVTASGKVPNIVQWNQGQAEYGMPQDVSTYYYYYYSKLAWLYPYLLNSWGLTSSQLPFNVWISGRASYGSSQFVNAAQLYYASTVPGARLGTAYYDLTYVDGTHVNAASYQIMGDRQARIDLKGLGVSGFFCSVTPRILGGWRVTNQLIEIITDSPCGLHTHSWVSSLTGWEVFNADYSWYVPISAVWLAGSAWGTSIFIQTAAATAPNLHVYFWRTQYLDPSAPSFANDVSLGVNGNPTAPLPFGLQTPN